MAMIPIHIKDIQRGGRPKSKQKYGARRMIVDGHDFPSERQANRYRELKLSERAGQITDLEIEVPYDISINGYHVCTYIADAVYSEQGRRVVEDSKGMATPVYKLKRRLMKAVHNVEILET